MVNGNHSPALLLELLKLNTAVVYVNLEARPERRLALEEQLQRLELSAVRQPGVEAARVRDGWGFLEKPRYACSLAKRLAIRRGFRTGAEAVLLLEDDVVMDAGFREKLARLAVPQNWGLFFLGCRHEEKPKIISQGLVRCTLAVDHHAVLVHRRYRHAVLRGLAGHRRGAPGGIRFSDEKLAWCQRTIPSYAAWPNLAWQRTDYSDTGATEVSQYFPDGRQKAHPAMMAAVDAEMRQRMRHEDRWPTSL